MVNSDAARETARQPDGKFGTQPLNASGGVDLTPPTPVFRGMSITRNHTGTHDFLTAGFFISEEYSGGHRIVLNEDGTKRVFKTLDEANAAAIQHEQQLLASKTETDTQPWAATIVARPPAESMSRLIAPHTDRA